MKHLVLAAAVLASPFLAANPADACAMRRREPVVVAKVAPKPAHSLADARAAEARGERQTAIRLYEAIMNAPGAVEERGQAALAAARLLAADGQQARAVARAQKAVGFAPRDAQAQLLLGELMVHDEAGRAMAHLVKAEALGGADAMRLALAKARAYAAFGDAANARAQLDTARDLGAPTADIAAVEMGLNPAQVAGKI